MPQTGPPFKMASVDAYAVDARAALRAVPSEGGTIYSEEPGETRTIRMRDVPLVRQPRQFASRNVYVYGGSDVSE
jgi:CRISPR system Cascade subunit CasD